MRTANRWVAALAGCLALASACSLFAQDWPQWRGLNRDGKVTGFTAPQTWPKALAQKWKTTVGLADATPALVGDKLFVFARQGSDEVILCLDAGSGKELWQNKYAAEAASGPSGSHPGPRNSPTVADGKVVTLGVSGVVSCVDAADGKTLCATKSTRMCPDSIPPCPQSLWTEWPSCNLAGRATGQPLPSTWPPAKQSGNGPAPVRGTHRPS